MGAMSFSDIDGYDPDDTEDGVLVCHWTADSDGVRGWMVSKPTITAHAGNIDDLSPALATAILEGLGCMMPMIELVPPPPATGGAEVFCTPELFTVGGQHRPDDLRPRGASQVEVRDYWSQFYEGGLCASCGKPKGDRNARPLDLRIPAPYYSAAFVMPPGGNTALVSQRFVDALTHDEVQALGLREIVQFPYTSAEPGDWGAKATESWFEVLGPATVPLVPDIGDTLQPCPSCGREQFSSFSSKRHPGMHHFTDAALLPVSLPSLFVAGGGRDGTRIGVTPERWSQLVATPATRGMMSSRLGVLVRPR